MGLDAFFWVFLAAQKSYQGKCNICDFGCQLYLQIAPFLDFLQISNITDYKDNMYKGECQINIWFFG